MNTVGKAGKLGEHVRCVVSVSMLTEGWDANTVTHILGDRGVANHRGKPNGTTCTKETATGQTKLHSIWQNAPSINISATMTTMISLGCSLKCSKSQSVG